MTILQNQRIEFDPTFGVNGKLDVSPPGNFRNDLSNLAMDASGLRLMIYGAYERETPNLSIPGVASLYLNGNFDTRFGDRQDGLTIAPPSILAQSASGFARLNNGSFFITGSASQQLPLLRYDHEGRLMYVMDLAEGPQYSTPRLLGMGEAVLLASSDRNGGVIYCRNYETEEPYFGIDGKATFLTGNSYVSTLHMARGSDDSFYLAGEVGNDGYILRMTRTGELDQGFADGGVYKVRMVDARYNACRRVIALPDGKVLALINGSGSDLGAGSHLIRLTATGRIDTTFNRGDPLRVPGEVGEDLTLQADGRILVANRGVMTGNQLTRYLPDGLLDIEFGNEGTGSITFTNEQISFVKAVMVQPDGKILIGGTSGSTTTLLRLLA
jgi:uncharacterized delta-60 repeat protein